MHFGIHKPLLKLLQYHPSTCCSVLHCVAKCCSVLQCVASTNPCSEVATTLSLHLLQCIAVCCSVLQYVTTTTPCSTLLHHHPWTAIALFVAGKSIAHYISACMYILIHQHARTRTHMSQIQIHVHVHKSDCKTCVHIMYIMCIYT